MKGKIVINESNIEEMNQLAEDVMQALYMNYFFYDEEGNECSFPTEKEKIEELCENPEWRLLHDLFRRGDKIEDVRYYTRKEIIPWIRPLLHKALQLFRKGTGDFGETVYVAAESVPDEYLIAAFAREVRNMMMIFAGQRMA